ncbi:hypothetical protein [Enterovirga rhinocerotis]|uniref:Uncharacterized protein n=1 Tax=Enterovirga rhinocerotis TaxID=1339210 RepID=A0A4R7C738_9HYPH|nr:hypothetical protein [Enterovirga rhinocerotis]TDR94208.1 hypothetical protein EV668_1488 [Enterovirga rhinocerotis]
MALPAWPADLPALVAPPGFGTDALVPEGEVSEYEGGNVRVRRRSLVATMTLPMRLPPLSRAEFVQFLDFLQRDLNAGVRRFVAPVRLPSGLLGLRICQIDGTVSEADHGPYSIVSFSVRVWGRDAYEPEAVALFARMSSAPSPSRKALISATIARLKYAGLWEKIGLLCVFAAHAPAPALVNWRRPTLNAARSGSPLPGFQVDRGYAGDGVGGFLDHGAGYASIPGVAPDSITDLVWSLTNLANTTAYDAGTDGASNRQVIMGRVASGLLSVRMASADLITAPVADSLGLYGATRSGSAVSLVRNGTVIGTGAATTNSTLQAGNIVSSRAGLNYSPRRLAMRIVGTALTPADHAALYAILRGYMVEIGAVS